MGKRISVFVYLFFTAFILLYAAIRVMINDSSVKKISIRSDVKEVSAEERNFFTRNKRFSAQEIQQSFPWIENVTIKNHQDGKLDIKIKHKKVVAFWTDGTSFYPLLENGTHISSTYKERPVSGLLFKGNTPENITYIIKTIRSYPNLASKTDYLEYIEVRRWDITLIGGAKILLPEQNIEQTINEIISQGMLNKTFKELDLRNPGRTLIK
jgi:cell division septal protein FtsQ